jgi:hypothetical protein
MPTRKRITCHVVAAIATGFLASCSNRPQPVDTQWQMCVDDKGNVIPDAQCEEKERQQRAGHHGGGILPYYWFYARGAQPVAPGGSIAGLRGGYEPQAGAPVARTSAFQPGHPNHPATRATTTRGIFGGRGYSAVG